MGLALDEPNDDDEKVEDEGLLLVASKDLVADLGGIDISLRSANIGGGFIIRPKKGAVGRRCSC